MPIDFSDLALEIESPTPLQPIQKPKKEKKKKSDKIDFSDLAISNDAPKDLKDLEILEPPTSIKEIIKSVGKTTLETLPGGRILTEPEEAKKVYEMSRAPVRKSREGLKRLTDKIPDPETKSTAINVALGTPKALAEIFSEMSSEMLSPEALALMGQGVTARKVAKLPQTKQLAKKVINKIPETIKRWVTYRYNQPELYKELAEQRAFYINEGAKEAIDLAKPLMKLPDDLQRQAASYMKGELDGAVLTPEVREAADNARQAFIKLGREAVDLGLLPEKVFQQNFGKYLPRLYRSKEAAKLSARKGMPKGSRIPSDRFKRRKDIPDDVRESMGEILEAGFPTATGLLQLKKAVETARLFKNVAKNAEWATTNAEEALAKGFKKLGKSKAFGDLSGKYVHPEIAADLEQIRTIPTAFEKIWNKWLGRWKFSKVILNPSTHFRNMLSNSILMDLGGVDQLKQARLLPKALKEIKNKGKYFIEAKAARLLGQEFIGGELRNLEAAANLRPGNVLDTLGRYSTTLAKGLQKAKMGIQSATQKLSNLYQNEEQLFKLAKFIDNRQKGMNIMEAAKDAEKYLFNYSKVSPLVEKLRRSPIGSPFITFTAKALPRVAETAVFNPIRLYKYKLLFDAIETKAKEELNLSDEEVETIHRNTRGHQIVMPFKDSEGRPQTLDLSYIMLWGDIGEQGGWFGLPPIAPPAGPVKTIAEIGMNKNIFLNKPIWEETDLPSQKIKKAINHFGTSVLPSLTPGYDEEDSLFRGGYSWRKIIRAIKKDRGDYFGRQNDLPYVLAGTLFGLKLTPAVPQEQLSFEYLKKKKLTEELQRQTIKKFRSQAVSKSYKEKLPELYLKQLERIWEEKGD